MSIVKQYARQLSIVTAMLAAALLTIVKPAQAVDAGTAVGIGLGSLALGSALGSTARPYPSYYPDGYYYPAPAYYAPPPPYYYPPRSCWDPYYRRYYAC